ncbi:hypothetical protein M2451_001914 [Dysgonomonas sp. PFB1-18]|uniref:glycosyl hydrolase n=1 Tax=unclassified Dysgonomonas TaxID=2630389 RepID=UPI002474A1E6|nr:MULTISPECIES: glycosyl hydrolase [unclassified Dysgonomonas]MDH6309548.1 hypothetical protein [Dysgonomonas sp. PF1-14]MDH6339124.1 hypothetical protein [Dysgonomonas sp. PF1-16]MDH6380590.1 hypothetical protein [Dysgonomonas sp. PFB1-18]MDH6398086.1 hypothetical protein [Dysgonomonas sp. PF1-23]
MRNIIRNYAENAFSLWNHIAFILVLAIALSSCENSDLRTAKDNTDGVATLKVAVNSSSKKGVGMSTSTTNGVWYQNVSNLNSNWYYTWGTFIPDAQQANAPDSEFVPMLWSGSAVTDANIAKLNTLYEQGKIKYVLGFNEPDLKEEANMTVEVALEKWAYLCQNLNPGIKLVSPVTSYPSLKETSWMVQFMDAAIARGLRVDYVGVHIYQPNTASLFTNPISNIYARWGKKVWLTEFGVRDENTGGDPTKNRYTREQILAFMEVLIPQLESMEAVERYAWFSASPTMAGLWPCGLINADGSLTINGQYYSNFGMVENSEFAGGDGSVNNPYLIANASQFNRIREEVSKSYKLIADVNLSTLVPAWTPIPSFSGNIDGNNRQIKGLKYGSIATKGGLITTNTGNIKNISFPDVDITATSAFGVIVGDHSVGIIDNIVVKGTLKSTNTGDLLGGIAAEITGGQISNVYANLTIETTCGMVGGIAGRAKTGASVIANCTTEGSISVRALKTRIAGIVGRGESAVAIRNCLSTMSISATVGGVNGVGGIFGANNNDNMSIDECMFTGRLNNVFMCGGIAGVGANIRNCLVEGQGADMSSPMITVGGTINTSSGGGICGTGKGVIENCVVRNAALSGVTTTALPIAGISSTFQNNGYVSKSIVSNVLLNGTTVHAVAGTAANGTGANADNYVSEMQYFEGGALSSYVPVDNKSGLDGAVKKAADLYERFYRARDFDMANVWRWDTDKPVLVNVGYKGSIAY